MSRNVLVTGATGTNGNQLATRLAARDDLAVRAFVRDPAKAADLAAAGVDLATGTFEDGAAVRAAVEGIDVMVLITAPNPDANVQAGIAIDAAKAAGVDKIVRLSAIKAAVDGPTDNTRLHGQTDKAIIASGLTYVILRPHYFMQNLFTSADSIAGDGKFYLGMGAGRLGMIDARDIVDCMEMAVVSDDFDDQIVDLTGPESIDFGAAAATLSAALGRPVDYVAVPPEAVAAAIRDMGLGDWMADVLRDYSQAYSENWGDFTTGEVARMTGHPARSFADFAREVLAPALPAA
jgi:NAD(P)H dehydrogenase (quinone)